MKSFELVHIPPSIAPALSPFARSVLDGSRPASTATPRLADLDHVEFRSGAAWSDARTMGSLREDHHRWGADQASHVSLERLAAGAACVVTGQQPALLLGPLYSAYKILGTIALARELERRHARPVVPVFWSGGDDSDFEEIRTAWLWRAGDGPYRAQLARSLWSEGQRVGSVRGAEIAQVERDAVEALGRGPGRDRLLTTIASMQRLDALGDRAAAWALRSFPGSGLVVVDARSAPLRALGRGIFAQYVARHGAITERLRDHSRALRDSGSPTPVDDRALDSGLFAVEGEKRRKLLGDELARARGDLAPSVLLRPVWQDAMLAPVAAVLGPAELQYHAQIAPLYGEFGVAAARPAPRPHLTLWPGQAPWIEPTGEHAAWLGGGEALRSGLLATHVPEAWSRAWTEAAQRVEAALAEFGARVDDDPARDATRATLDAVRRELAGLRRRLGQRATQREGIEISRVESWLRWRGTPQERCYASPHFWWWMGEHASSALEVVASEYVAAIDSGRSPTWILRGGTQW